MQRIGRARKRPFLFFWVEHLLFEGAPAWQDEEDLGSAVVFSEIHLTGRVKLALPSRIDRKSLRRVMRALLFRERNRAANTIR